MPDSHCLHVGVHPGHVSRHLVPVAYTRAQADHSSFLFIFTMVAEVQLGRIRHRQKRFGHDGLPPSKVDDGVSRFSPMRWFGMHMASNNTAYAPPTAQVPTAAGALQVGTVKNFGDDDHLETAHESPANQPQTPLLTQAPSQLSLPQTAQMYPAVMQPSQPVYQHAEYQPRPSLSILHQMQTNYARDPYPAPSMRRSDTYDSQHGQSFAPYQRVDSYMQQPSQSPLPSQVSRDQFSRPLGPPQRADTFQPQGIRRAGSMPMVSFQRTDMFPTRSYSPPRAHQSNLLQHASQIDLYDPIIRLVHRTLTDNVLYMQSDRPHPFQQTGRTRTNSFPYTFQGNHVRSNSDSSPRYITPPPAGTMPHPDARYLRPDVHPPRARIPYPDNHPERVMFPGDDTHVQQRQDRVYPNYEYDDSIFNHPR